MPGVPASNFIGGSVGDGIAGDLADHVAAAQEGPHLGLRSRRIQIAPEPLGP
jgi:hypothetical protein